MAEYVLDEANKTATLIWEYPEDERIFAPYMGGAQRLPNGNTMIGWGAVKQITEVTEAGSVVFEMVMGGRTYRAYRFPWEGNPAKAPRLVLSPESSSITAVLYFSWNGATDVNAYDIYAGADETSLALVYTVDREGFETRAELDSLPEDTCTFQVVPQLTDPTRDTPPSNIAYWLERPDCLDLFSHRVYLPLITNAAPGR